MQRLFPVPVACFDMDTSQSDAFMEAADHAEAELDALQRQGWKITDYKLISLQKSVLSVCLLERAEDNS